MTGVATPMTRRELRRADQERGGYAAGLFGRDLLFPLVLAIPLAVSTVLSPLLTRLLGPVGFGVVATVLSVNQLVVGFAALGMDQAVLIQRATDTTSRAARGLVSVAILLTSVVTLGIVGAAQWWGPAFGFEPASSVVPEAVVWSGFATVILVVGNLLMAESRLGAFSVLSLASTVGAQVVGTVLVVLGQRSAGAYVRGLMITSAVRSCSRSCWHGPASRACWTCRRPGGRCSSACLWRSTTWPATCSTPATAC